MEDDIIAISKGTVSEISIDLPRKDGNAQFTTVPLNLRQKWLNTHFFYKKRSNGETHLNTSRLRKTTISSKLFIRVRFQGFNVVNRTAPSLHGGSLETMFTVDHFNKKLIKSLIKLNGSVYNTQLLCFICFLSPRLKKIRENSTRA